jgi:hypothetical protein
MKQIQQSERRLPTASHRDPVGTVEARQVGPSSAVPPELSPLSQANELFARASPNRSTRSLQGLPPGWKDTRRPSTEGTRPLENLGCSGG